MHPTHVDQTKRFEQHWSLVVPRLQKQLHIGSRKRLRRFSTLTHGSALPPLKSIRFPEKYLFEPDHGWNAWTLLARPVGGNIPPRHSRRVEKDLSTLEKLPAEILAEIIADESLEAEDVVAFGLSSSSLWTHVLHHIVYYTYKQSGIFAGERLAVLGSHLKTLPAPFEADDFMKATLDFELLPELLPARQILWQASARYAHIPTDCSQQKWCKGFDEATAHYPPSSSAHLSARRKELSTCSSVAPPPPMPNSQLSSSSSDDDDDNHDDEWILRNLTTKQYVRIIPGDRNGPDSQLGIIIDDASPPVPQPGFFDDDHHPGEQSWRIPRRPALLVDHVLLLRICWFEHLYGHQNQARPFGAMEQGVWAGHAFDIVPRAELDAAVTVAAAAAAAAGEAGDGSGKWRDVTREVVEEAMVLIDKVDGGSWMGYQLGERNWPYVDVGVSRRAH